MRAGLILGVFLFCQSAFSEVPLPLLELSLDAVRKTVLNEALALTQTESNEDQASLERKIHDRIEELPLPNELKSKVSGKPIQVSAGSSHSLILMADGSVFAFGSGVQGKLGLGDIEFQFVPKLLNSESVKGVIFSQVVAGPYHSLILSEDGIVYSFGNGNYGQLGHGSLQDHWVPTPIDPGHFKNQKIIQIAVGNYHSLVLTELGEVYSFGSGASGQLGQGNTRNQLSPKGIEDTNLMAERVIQVAAGGEFSLVLTESGQVYSFGCGNQGQLGHGDLKNEFHPRPIHHEVLNGERVVRIVAGYHQSFLFTSPGKVHRFGTGTIESHNPQISLEKQWVTQVASNAFHTLMLTQSGEVFVFGEGSVGQLGLGKSRISEKFPQKLNVGWMWSTQDEPDSSVPRARHLEEL